MIGCRETECGLKLFKEFSPESGYKSWVTVTDDGARDSMYTNDVVDE